MVMHVMVMHRTMTRDVLPITAASDDEVAYFAQRRRRDERGARLYRDLAAQAPNGAFTARDDGTPIGIAFAHALEDEWFLSELFVEPSFRGQGLGLALLSAAAQDAGDVTRSGYASSAELEAAAFLTRRGVALATPVLQVSGALPSEKELARMAAGEYRFQTSELEPSVFQHALNELDREVRGSARPLDHAYFSEHARGIVFTRQAEIAGYAYVWNSGRIGPVVVASEAYAIQIFGFALAALHGMYRATWCSMLVPGSNVRIARTAMRAGLQLEGLGYFASDARAIDLSRYVGFDELLF